MGKTTTTTIDVSRLNRELLDKLGDEMQRRHPETWLRRPPLNAIVGYAVTSALLKLEDDECSSSQTS